MPEATTIGHHHMPNQGYMHGMCMPELAYWARWAAFGVLVAFNVLQYVYQMRVLNKSSVEEKLILLGVAFVLAFFGLINGTFGLLCYAQHDGPALGVFVLSSVAPIFGLIPMMLDLFGSILDLVWSLLIEPQFAGEDVESSSAASSAASSSPSQDSDSLRRRLPRPQTGEATS